MFEYARTYKVPGVYIDPDPKRIEPITLANKCLTGFAGFAEKGPLDTGLRVTSFYEYQKIFGGFIEYGYLAYSVYGFFNSGGRECIVVRIAHQSLNDIENSAQIASLSLYNIEGELAYEMRARNIGTWGNLIQIKLWYKNSTPCRVLERSDRNDWQEWLKCSSVEELEVGDIVCVMTDLIQEYRTIMKIENGCIFLNKKLEFDFDPVHKEVFFSRVSLNLIINHRKERIFEEYFDISANINSKRYFVDIVNSQSALAEVVVSKPGTMPNEVSFINLNGGKNGILGITPADFIGYFKGLGDAKGIGIFENYTEIALIVAPDVMIFNELIENNPEKANNAIFTVQKAMIDQCERLENRFAILDCPDNDDFIKLLKWRDRFDSKYAALYYPMIEMLNPEDSTSLTSIFVPPSGHIAGVYAETDELEGIHRAPANKFIKGAVGLNRFIEDDEYEVTYPKGLNCLKYLPGKGIKIWGARTISSDPEWRYINVRRTFSVIRDAIRSGTAWAVFEPNDSSLRKRIERHITAFLLDLWKKGYMAGVEPDDGFYVISNDEMNPPEEVDAGRINVEIGIAIARPAEFLVIKVKADTEQGLMSYSD